MHVNMKSSQEFLMLMTDFIDWKSRQEEINKSSFIKQTGSKTGVSNNVTTYYYCNRSGFYASKTISCEGLACETILSSVTTFCT